MEFETVIGLEVHAQMKTKSMIFCRFLDASRILMNAQTGQGISGVAELAAA